MLLFVNYVMSCYVVLGYVMLCHVMSWSCCALCIYKMHVYCNVYAAYMQHIAHVVYTQCIRNVYLMYVYVYRYMYVFFECRYVYFIVGMFFFSLALSLSIYI